MNRLPRACWILTSIYLCAIAHRAAAADGLAEKIRSLPPGVVVVGTVRQPPLAGMFGRHHAARLQQANQSDRQAWSEVRDRATWERFRDARLHALRTSLGKSPSAPSDLKIERTRTLSGDGYQVDNLVVETRPGLLMTANLYRPASPTGSMPGVLIVHSHLQPKHTTWRQDMAMTWARAGCVVIVPDLLGHGERRQHPFPESSPHDYHFRFDAAIQFSLIGDSLMGWFAWDLMRAVDVLLKQPGVDARRIIAVSEPAGGGDVAAVTAALDTRIAGAVINNFGGPQPETPYPLPGDAETSFEYAGRGSWELTRNLRQSAGKGFLPWTIVASIAPRRVIYYHEFYWDRDHDPVWKRLQRVWGWYDASDHLAGLAGRGFVVGSEPENTHWLPESRELFYPVLERWFKIPNPGREYSQRRPVEDLLCLTESQRANHRPAHELVAQIGAERAAAARQALDRLEVKDRRAKLQRDWTQLLGDISPGQPTLGGPPVVQQTFGQFRVERLHLMSEPGIVVPTLLLLPVQSGQQTPVVIGLSQQGKHEFLKQRAAEIADLLRQGVAVCLPDVRGTGETSTSDARDRRSAATAIAAGELMLSETVLGGRLRDLRTLMAYLRTQPAVDGRRIALWGESFAPANADNAEFKVAYTAAQRPQLAEPLGGLLSLLGGLYEDDVRAVSVRGCLCDYQSLLASPFTYVAFDAIVPGAIAVGDIPALTTGLAPRSLRITDSVDGHDRRVPKDKMSRIDTETAAADRSGSSSQVDLEAGSASSVVAWLVDRIRDESPPKR